MACSSCYPLARSTITHSELAPHKSIINQEIVGKTCLQTNLMETYLFIFQVRFPLPIYAWACDILAKSNQHSESCKFSTRVPLSFKLSSTSDNSGVVEVPTLDELRSVMPPGCLQTFERALSMLELC